ncbi:unnamed protein product [Arctogadus glacialis]
MILLCSILLGSLALSQSTTSLCDDLIKPLEQMPTDHLEGRWSMVAGSHNDQASEEASGGLRRQHCTSVSHLRHHRASGGDLIKPLEQMPTDHLEGRWSMVAGSHNDQASEESL